MWIGLMHLAEQTMMPEQGAKSRCSQVSATLPAFQGDEQGGRVGQWSFYV
jgi:hypothetical protein